MLRWVINNYKTFIWSLALAISVWVVAVTAADPDETRALTNPIPVEVVGQDPGLVISGDIPSEVKITLRAPRSVWDMIDADPRTIRALLDLSGLAVGEHNANLQIQISARPVKLITASPQSVTFNLEPLDTRTMDIDLSISGEVAIGYQAGDPLLEPARVVVAGAASQVRKVTRVRAAINLNRIREDLDQTIKIEALDENGLAVSDITVSPESVRVIMPVTLQGGYRDVAVKVVTTGRVASGYRLTDISVFPPVVTLFTTDSDLVNNLPGVLETQPLDLNNARDDINTRLALNLPAGISIVGEQTVLIEAGVSAIESSVTLAGEKVEIVGLAADMTAQVSPPTVDVIVSGPLPVLDTLTRQDVHVTVDLTDLASGTHQITPRVEVLIADIVVQSILPITIEVIISPVATPTPAPAP